MTVFLSAFLLFQVQPLIGKTILPWYGGSAATWMTCLLFFQVLLVGGYLYVHLLASRLSPRGQGLVHLAVLAASLLLLPITPSPAWKPTGNSDPTSDILMLLLVSVGGPFFVLSTTGPLIQAWYARERPGRSPYHLYSLSNAGSFVALLSYPFAIEPYLRLHVQASVWSWSYVVFALLCAAWAVRTVRSRRASPPMGRTILARAPHARPAAESASIPDVDAARSAELEFVTAAMWVVLSACGSALLLATTNQITQEVAPVPLLWVLPLSLYLLSFVLCFGRRSWYRRKVVGWLFAGSLFAVALATWDEVELPLVYLVAIHGLVLFAACLACHGELAALQPSPRHLTAYYLSISIGGAIGGAAVTLAAPTIFDSLVEFPISLAACFVAWAVVERRAALRDGLRRRFSGLPVRLAIEGASVIVLAAVAVPLVAAVWNKHLAMRGVVDGCRNFYGVLQVIERGTGERERHRLQLAHGSTTHGVQFRSAALRGTPTAYYGRGSGLELGLQLERLSRGRPLRIGAVGMGAGVVAAYATDGDEVAFYEINPDVERLARKWFTFLEDAESRGARVDVRLGDARLMLERELESGSEPYDMLVVDAFSSDSIPVHLMTRECFDVYRRRLADDGLLCLHVSNLYLELAAVARVQCEELGWEAALLSSNGDADASLFPSDWVIASPRPERIDALRPPPGALRPWPAFRGPAWTDAHSSLLSLLK